MVTTQYHAAPLWLTEAYMESVLQKYKANKSLRITKLILQPATGKGENYASIMTRISVYFQSDNNNADEPQHEQYIVKTGFEDDPNAEAIFSKYNTYQTEMVMYEQILPKLSKLLVETGEGDKLFANTVHVDYERTAIIFEDLAVNNYTTLDRIKGMDMLYTKLALKKLAKMHAAAAVLNEREPNVLDKFDHGIFNRHTSGFSPFFMNMIGVCAEFAGECAELGNYYKEKLIKLRENCIEYATRVFDANDSRYFFTLNHGDYWINNVMTRTSGEFPNEVQDLIIIDFQFSCWGSPAVDLHYFLNTSLEAKLRFEHEDELIKYYYDVLTHTLRHLKFEGFIPSFHEFWLQLEAGRFYAVTSALASQPVMITDQTEDADFNALMKEDERGRKFRKSLYANNQVQEYMKKILPIFDAKGLLD